ncbi:MAG: hypothetical protein KKA62_00520 [Nanoarchaeota archaeon]|nr:hypothetical protein [Nanoarchaeota archaeon]MBU1644393.1 hypothetical protein [Nanoarchaeota archaeon]MBU1976420.1 hypothetical protein [Nanoarchaeota archaeon]
MAAFLDYITQGTRIFFSSLKNRYSTKKYEGDASSICQNIVKDCWNGRYFQTSTGNFSQFWTRDFGWCTRSLVKLGYTEEVHQTLRFALNRFKHHKKTATTLTPRGKPFDFPTNSVDTLPWLIHSIKISKFPYYSYKNFLNKEIQKFFNLAVNPHTGLVKPEAHFSSMKDFSIRKSSCYDNCMVALLAKNLKEMKRLDNPFSKFDYEEIIRRHFWNGKYFYDDLTKQDYVAGDSNLFPFALGIINDKELLHSALNAIHEAGLDEPWPLKYTTDREKVVFIWQENLMKDYESNALWSHMGLLYIKLLQTVDPERAKEYQKRYTEQIEKHQNFLEVFDAEGRPFRSIYYFCDSGMLWAANYLTL